MGRKFIIEEVEEESKFGCGSIVATIIIALVIGLCGGFKSCKEDKKPKAVESRTEQPQRLDEVKVQSPPYVPKKFASECFRTDFNHRIQAAERSLSRTHNGNILR